MEVDMLFHIVDAKNDDSFKKYVGHAKNAYWPTNLRDQGKDAYAFTKLNDGNRSGEYMQFPFTDRFRKYFQKKLRENKPGNDDPLGNLYHFENVVAATARLIEHFKTSTNVLELFKQSYHPTKHELEDLKSLCKTVSYGDIPDMRTFKLMLAAFYHDLGKTVVDHRHGMEGAIILTDNTTQSQYQLGSMAKKYSTAYALGRDDISFFSDLLFYHDQFGMLSTGESGYLRLVDAVDRIKRCSMKYMGCVEKQDACSYQSLFDLWLLNIADIIVSIKDKFIEQGVWLAKKSAKNKIKEFFEQKHQAGSLTHDLRIAFRLLKEHNREMHTDDTSALGKAAQEQCKQHAAQRIRRILTASLDLALEKKPDEPEWKAEMEGIIKGIRGLSMGYKNSAVVRSIQSIGDLQEFCIRLSWIGSMDYSLGFFSKIAKRALEKISEELSPETNQDILSSQETSKKEPTVWQKTNWIRPRDKEKDTKLFGDEAGTYLDKVNAQFFIDNYADIVVRIFGHLLFRERTIESLRNIEFEDARTRLTEEKIDKILVE
jgi:hypothetical protein